MSSAIELYPYQKAWLADKNRFKIGMFARQTGKTFTSTLEIVDNCIQQEMQGKRKRWVILSRGERQAREAMDEGVKRHLKAFEMAFDAVEYDWETGDKALEVSLPGGSKITALPANPGTARGFSASVFLDEFAFHKDSRAIWKALFPVISAGHDLRVVSTPNGKGNKFYELMTSDDGAWSRHTVDIYEAVRQGLPRDIDQLRQALGDKDAWSQEFELHWLDEATSWLSFDLINTCEHEAAGFVDAYQCGLCYIGNDIARRNDLWVAWVFEAVGDVLWTREIVALRRASFAEQDAVMDDLFKRYRVRRLCMDQTGMGEKPVEDAIRRYGSSRVEGILFTGPNKQTLATIGKQNFEDRRLRIPAGDQELRQDLHKLKKVVSPIGNIRFDADRDEQGHSDRAWACFLGLYAASGTNVPIDFEPVEVQRGMAGVGGGGMDGFTGSTNWSGY